MSRAHNDVLLIDDDPSDAKAFEEALIASLVTAHRISNGLEPSPAASNNLPVKEYGQSFSTSSCPIAVVSKH